MPGRCRRARLLASRSNYHQQALDMGLKYNLGLYLSDRVTDQARAARLKA